MAALMVLLSLLAAGEDRGGRGALGVAGSLGGSGAAAGGRQRGGCRSAGNRRRPRPSRLPLGLLVRPTCGGEAWRAAGAGPGCVGAPEPASTLRLFQEGAAAGPAACLFRLRRPRDAFPNSLWNRSPLRGRESSLLSCHQMLRFLAFFWCLPF